MSMINENSCIEFAPEEADPVPAADLPGGRPGTQGLRARGGRTAGHGRVAGQHPAVVQHRQAECGVVALPGDQRRTRAVIARRTCRQADVILGRARRVYPQLPVADPADHDGQRQPGGPPREAQPHRLLQAPGPPRPESGRLQISLESELGSEQCSDPGAHKVRVIL